MYRTEPKVEWMVALVTIKIIAGKYYYTELVRTSPVLQGVLYKCTARDLMHLDNHLCV